jgi:hypothetical protein
VYLYILASSRIIYMIMVNNPSFYNEGVITWSERSHGESKEEWDEVVSRRWEGEGSIGLQETKMPFLVNFGSRVLKGDMFLLCTSPSSYKGRHKLINTRLFLFTQVRSYEKKRCMLVRLISIYSPMHKAHTSHMWTRLTLPNQRWVSLISVSNVVFLRSNC